MLIFVIVAATEGGVGEVSSLSLPLELLRSICRIRAAGLLHFLARRRRLGPSSEMLASRSWLLHLAPPHLKKRRDAREDVNVNEYLTRLRWSSEYYKISRITFATQQRDT